MRLTCSKFRLFLFGAALAAAGWALCAKQAAGVAAEPLGTLRSPGAFPAVGTAGAAADVKSPNPDSDPEERAWERQIERVERKRLIAIIVFLSIVFLLLLFWWSWGKIHHRARKL